MAEKAGLPLMAKGHRLHGRCGTRHHVFHACPDGFVEFPPKHGKTRLPQTRNGSTTREGDGPPAVAGTAEAGPASAPPEPTPPASSALVTDPDEIRRMMARLADLEGREAERAEVERAEVEHRDAEERSGMRLARPAILRKPSEVARERLLAELDDPREGVLARARREAKNIRTADDLKRAVTAQEAAATRELLGSIPERRDERERAKIPPPVERPSGEQEWECRDCRTRFRSLSIEGVRRWARDHPGEKFGCPECGGTTVRSLEGAAA